MVEKMSGFVKNDNLLVIILFSLVVVGVVILLSLLSFARIERFIIGQVGEQQLTETQFAANQIENHIFAVQDELVTLTKFPEISSLTLENCQQTSPIHEQLGGKLTVLLKADSDGDVIACSSSRFSSYVDVNIANKDFFLIPKTTNVPYITASSVGSAYQIIVAAPLFATTEYTPYPNFVGEFKGLLFTVFEVQNLFSLYLEKLVQKDRFFLLINPVTQQTLLKSRGIRDYAELQSLGAMKENHSIAMASFPDLNEVIVTNADFIVGKEKWRLIMITPVDTLNAEINTLKRGYLISLGLVTAVILIILFAAIAFYHSKEKVQLKLDKAQVTLEKLGVQINTEETTYTQADVVLEPGNIYLISDDEENHAHELFIGTLNRGFVGLALVREDPRQLRKKYNLYKTPFIWLTKEAVTGIPCEHNIETLSGLIAEFLAKSKQGVVLIDRIDYLFFTNNPEQVIREIQSLHDSVSGTDHIIILTLQPELLSASQKKAIEMETIDLYGKHLRKRTELTDIEMNILRVINERNVMNKLVSYRDITETFHITKPTTRAKMRHLVAIGLVLVDQKGRFKSIKITSAGRKVLSYSTS